MSRSLTAILFFVLLAGPTAAEERKIGDPLPLLVSGAPTPTPSLKYRLAPDRRELIPGNAATLYYRTYALLWENSVLFKDLKEKHWYEWTSMPLDQLPRDEVRQKVQAAKHMIREINLAGRRRDCDWQLDGRSDGIGLLLPEVQGYRTLASVLAVKTRLAIAEGRPDEAIDTLRSGFTFSRNIARGPTLIHVLVGLACSQVLVKQVEELIQQPDAPNLYWALTTLPHPFIDPRGTMLEEANWLEDMLPFLGRLEGAPMTLTEMQAAIETVRKMLDNFQLRTPSRLETWTQAAYIEAAQKEARESLVKQGLKADVVAAMPAFQAVTLYAYRDYRDSREEVLKWIQVPEGRKHPGFAQASQRFERSGERLDRLLFRGLLRGLGGIGSPAYENVFKATNRLERRLAALRCVEALRMHAARHGRWPARLEDVKDVPVPTDPLTGKPFDYQFRDANHAVVGTPAPTGEPQTPDMTYIYELELRK